MQESLRRSLNVPHLFQGGSEEENEHLVYGAGSSNGATARSAVPSGDQPRPAPLEPTSKQCPNSPSPPPSPVHLNHSTASHDGLNNVTNLTTLSVVEGEGEAAPDRARTDNTSQQATVATTAAAAVTTSTPYHHHHNPGAGATRAASPRPSLTMAQ